MQLIIICSYAYSVPVVTRCVPNVKVVSGEDAFLCRDHLDKLVSATRKKIEIENNVQIGVLVPPDGRGALFINDIYKKMKSYALVFRISPTILTGGLLRATINEQKEKKEDELLYGDCKKALREEAIAQAALRAIKRATSGSCCLKPFTAMVLLCIHKRRQSRLDHPTTFVSALSQVMGQFHGYMPSNEPPVSLNRSSIWTASVEENEYFRSVAAATTSAGNKESWPWYLMNSTRSWLDVERLWAAGAGEYPTETQIMVLHNCPSVPAALVSVHNKYKKVNATGEDKKMAKTLPVKLASVDYPTLFLFGNVNVGVVDALKLPKQVVPPIHCRSLTPDPAHSAVLLSEVLLDMVALGISVGDAQKSIRTAIRRGFIIMDTSIVSIRVKETGLGMNEGEETVEYTDRVLAKVLPEISGPCVRLLCEGEELIEVLKDVPFPDWTANPSQSKETTEEVIAVLNRFKEEDDYIPEMQKEVVVEDRLPDLPSEKTNPDRILRELHKTLSLRLGRTVYLHYQPCSYRAPSFISVKDIDDDVLTCDVQVFAEFLKTKGVDIQL